MPRKTVEAMVDGGKASAGPPLGPALGPLGVNIPEIIKTINEKTKEMAGMKIPVKVTVDTETKRFDVSVGSPPTAALIKKELGLKKGSGQAGKMRAGDLSEEQAKRIARVKFGSDAPAFVSQVRGTCRSMGITIGMGAVTEEEIRLAKEAIERAAAEKAAAKEPGEAAEAEAGTEKKEAAKPAAPGERPEKPAEKKEAAKPAAKKEERKKK